MNGTVYLVGAGPGAADLLTLRALRLLEQAGVLFHDALVSREILSLAPNAIKVEVGKRSGRLSTAQNFINKRLVDAARVHDVVVRLKGGDPLIFGRGGEEIETLAEHGIAFEIVPGVTAAAGAAAYAGIPLTHRNHAHSCVFVTGHLKEGEPELDWEALATPRQTIAIYMGVKGLPLICERLAAHGLPKDLPAAIVQRATLDQQRVLVGTLATLPESAAREGFRPPALVIVGEVVRLREKLAWFAPGAIKKETERPGVSA